MWKSAGRAPCLRVFTLAFALQLRKKHGKTTVRVRETSVKLINTSVRLQYTYYKDTHTLQNRHKHTEKLTSGQKVTKSIPKCHQYFELIYNEVALRDLCVYLRYHVK
jgi:hypothetical protein